MQRKSIVKKTVNEIKADQLINILNNESQFMNLDENIIDSWRVMALRLPLLEHMNIRLLIDALTIMSNPKYGVNRDEYLEETMRWIYESPDGNNFGMLRNINNVTDLVKQKYIFDIIRYIETVSINSID